MNTKRTDAIGKVMLLQLFLFCIHSIISTFTARLGQNISMAIGCATILAVFLLPILFYRKSTGRKITDYLSTKNRDDRTRNLPKSVLLFLFAVCLTLTAVNLLGQITELALFFTKKPKPVIPKGIAQCILFFLRYVLLAAIFEELLFRGITLDALDGADNKTKILVSSLFFALIHYSLRSFLYAFAAGIILSYFAIKTGSIIFSIAVHFIQNLAAFIFAILSGVLAQSTYKAVVLTSFFITTAIAFAGVIYLIFDEKKIRSSAPVSAKTINFSLKNIFSAELVLFICLAGIITVLNF